MYLYVYMNTIVFARVYIHVWRIDLYSCVQRPIASRVRQVNRIERGVPKSWSVDIAAIERSHIDNIWPRRYTVMFD